LLDIERVAVLRSASNFDRPYPGQSAYDSLVSAISASTAVDRAAKARDRRRLWPKSGSIHRVAHRGRRDRQQPHRAPTRAHTVTSAANTCLPFQAVCSLGGRWPAPSASWSVPNSVRSATGTTILLPLSHSLSRPHHTAAAAVGGSHSRPSSLVLVLSARRSVRFRSLV
jgi:hypothetical protein